MGTKMKRDFSDEEEDLEVLRLAALSSLKKKNEANGYVQNQHISNEKSYIHNKTSFRGKRRFFSGQTGRGRNSQFNNQVRNSNLISIPTVNAESDICQPVQKTTASINKENDVPKLIRPQDRYANSIKEELGREGPSSKFDRYNNSDSDSEEEDEISSTKLERSDSLEALMEELDAEIQGEPKKEKKEKVKPKKETKSVESNESGVGNINGKECKLNEDNNEIITQEQKDGKIVDSSCKQLEEAKTSQNDEIKKEIANSTNKILNVNQNQHSPTRKKILSRKPNGRVFNSEHPFVPVMIPNPSFVTPVQPPQFTTVYNTVPSFTGSEVFPLTVPPPTFVPPPNLHSLMPLEITPAGYNMTQLPPLVIEHSSNLPSVPMGPLSPRSAAFVLQNRAIVEKRKRSPRRSYSRSPSPPSHRTRYSKSPPQRRSLTPLRRSLSPHRRSFSPSRRSVSPRRSPLRRSLSPYRRHREKSPRRESPRRSPRRTRESPIKSPKRTKDSPKRIRDSRKTPIKDRLGARSKTEEKEKKKELATVSSPSKKEDNKPLDPVLEARKRKFESKEIKVKEGVIRLKPKDEHNIKDEKVTTEIKAEKKVDEIKMNVGVIEKVKMEVAAKPSTKEESTRVILPVKKEEKCTSQESPKRDQLEEAMNELEMLLKDDEALELTAKVDELFTDEETDQENEGRFKGKKNLTSENSVRKVVNGINKKPLEKKKENKSKWNFDETRRETKSKMKKEPLTNPIENRKIEIKIRNPGKYEKCANKVQGTINKVSPERKVELAKKEEYSGDETEPEIIVENEGDLNEDIEEVPTSREGDLRAQLSRKRAERQNKFATVGGFQSRLLQNALEGAVFKKKKSKKKDKESKDVKLPIHLRLGIAHDSDIFAEAATEKISRRKSKKRKHAIVEQV